MKIIMLVIIFLLVGAFFIISENSLHLNKTEELNKFTSLYFSWFGGVFDNLKQTTAYVVKMDWLPN